MIAVIGVEEQKTEYLEDMPSLEKLIEDGIGVEQSHEKTVKWYAKAALQGHAAAQYALANCYTNGSGITPNLVKAAQWFEKAIEWYSHAAESGCDEAWDNIELLSWDCD